MMLSSHLMSYHCSINGVIIVLPGSSIKVEERAIGNAVDDDVEDVGDNQTNCHEDAHLGWDNVSLSILLHIDILDCCAGVRLRLEEPVEGDVAVHLHQGVGVYHDLINRTNLCTIIRRGMYIIFFQQCVCFYFVTTNQLRRCSESLNWDPCRLWRALEAT